MKSISRLAVPILIILVGFAQANAAIARPDDNSAALGPSDQDFVTEAAKGGMTEIEVSRLALEKATSSDVRQFAQTMIDDHSKAADELAKIAGGKGLTLPVADDVDFKKMLDSAKADLTAHSGSDFDKAYMHMMEADHAKMEKLFQHESAHGGDVDLKALASSTLPTVQHHLQMARDWLAKAKGD